MCEIGFHRPHSNVVTSVHVRCLPRRREKIRKLRRVAVGLPDPRPTKRFVIEGEVEDAALSWRKLGQGFCHPFNKHQETSDIVRGSFNFLTEAAVS
jgi:hypothetical protein